MIDKQLYELKKEFDKPLTEEEINEMESTARKIHHMTAEDWLQEFTI